MKTNKTKKNWLCQEGSEQFIMKATDRKEAEMFAEMYNAVVIGESKVEGKSKPKG